MASDTAGIAAALAVLAAWHQGLGSGQGQWIDVSAVEAMANLADWSLPMFSALGNDQVRDGGGTLYPIYRCADGHLRMVSPLTDREWTALVDWLGHAESVAGDDWKQPAVRISRLAQLRDILAEFFADKPRDATVADGIARGLAIAPILAPGEVLRHPHFESRHTFTDVEVAPGTTARLVDGFVSVDGVRAGVRTPPPPLPAVPGLAADERCPRRRRGHVGGAPVARRVVRSRTPAVQRHPGARLRHRRCRRRVQPHPRAARRGRREGRERRRPRLPARRARRPHERRVRVVEPVEARAGRRAGEARGRRDRAPTRRRRRRRGREPRHRRARPPRHRLGRAARGQPAARDGVEPAHGRPRCLGRTGRATARSRARSAGWRGSGTTRRTSRTRRASPRSIPTTRPGGGWRCSPPRCCCGGPAPARAVTPTSPRSRSSSASSATCSRPRAPIPGRCGRSGNQGPDAPWGVYRCADLAAEIEAADSPRRRAGLGGGQCARRRRLGAPRRRRRGSRVGRRAGDACAPSDGRGAARRAARRARGVARWVDRDADRDRGRRAAPGRRRAGGPAPPSADAGCGRARAGTRVHRRARAARHRADAVRGTALPRPGPRRARSRRPPRGPASTPGPSATTGSASPTPRSAICSRPASSRNTRVEPPISRPGRRRLS